MISNQILQQTVDGLKEITKIDLYVEDMEGNILAETAQSAENMKESIQNFVDSPADSQALRNNQFFKVYDEGQLEYVVVSKGEGEETYTIGRIAVFQLQNLSLIHISEPTRH